MTIGHESRSSTFFSPTRFQQQQHHLNEIMHEASNDSLSSDDDQSWMTWQALLLWQAMNSSKMKDWTTKERRHQRMPGRKSVKDHCVLFQPSGGISLWDKESGHKIKRFRDFKEEEKNSSRSKYVLDASSSEFEYIDLKVFNVRVRPKMKFTLTARFFLKSIVTIKCLTKYYRLFWASPL